MVPLRYLHEDAVTGCRIGGACPVGLVSQFTDSWTQYFGTFPLLEFEGTEFSIFHRFDPFGRDTARDLIDFNNRLLKPSDLIWVVVHPKSVRSEKSPNMFEARALALDPESTDEVRDDEGQLIPFSENKLGGRCFVDRHQVRDEVRLLEESGYFHLLQIGMVGRDLIKGFPWDPGYLNVWALNPLDPSSYRFCVQQ